MTAGIPATSADKANLGTPRPQSRVVLYSGLTGFLYYGYYEWMIQDELRAYQGKGVIPGLNLVVGLRQIHFLSEYWARLADRSVSDPIAERLPFLSNS
ncbi:hypothetical protein IQ241_22720 [Romeria aff. gracilis LEGE 07310]|uniref:Uncharacterized protein n=1 Tax=Vasconcelosia minhoensis LEGE 07310 TaxID=915328 RepID=A0A8J7AT92_9CYAN|nr:hypothetical protein [Romeria aff. gracilis LEGE 07310]